MRLLLVVLFATLAACTKPDYGTARAEAISSGAAAINREAGNYESYADFMAVNDSPFREEIADMGFTEPSQIRCAAEVATKHFFHPNDLANLDAAVTGHKPITAKQYDAAVWSMEYRLGDPARVSAMEAEMRRCK